jgi:hypothetical protein
MMTLDQKLKLFETINKAIWSCQWRNLGSVEASQKDFDSRLMKCGVKSQFISGGVVYARHFKGVLTGFDFEVITAPGQVWRLRAIQQNPNKRDSYGRLSEPAILARAGHQIVWFIDQNNDKFLGKFQDGKWFKSEPRAYTFKTAAGNMRTAFTGAGYQNAQAGFNFNNLPNVEPQDIPAEVESHDFQEFNADDGMDGGNDGFDMPWGGDA